MEWTIYLAYANAVFMIFNTGFLVHHAVGLFSKKREMDHLPDRRIADIDVMQILKQLDGKPDGGEVR